MNRGEVRLWWVFSRALVLTRNTKPPATTRNHADFPRRPPSNCPTTPRMADLPFFTSRFPLGLPLNLIAKISNFYQRLQVWSMFGPCWSMFEVHVMAMVMGVMVRVVRRVRGVPMFPSV